jgi:hypothetical protein
MCSGVLLDRQAAGRRAGAAAPRDGALPGELVRPYLPPSLKQHPTRPPSLPLLRSTRFGSKTTSCQAVCTIQSSLLTRALKCSALVRPGVERLAAAHAKLGGKADGLATSTSADHRRRPACSPSPSYQTPSSDLASGSDGSSRTNAGARPRSASWLGRPVASLGRRDAPADVRSRVLEYPSLQRLQDADRGRLSPLDPERQEVPQGLEALGPVRGQRASPPLCRRSPSPRSIDRRG